METNDQKRGGNGTTPSVVDGPSDQVEKQSVPAGALDFLFGEIVSLLVPPFAAMTVAGGAYVVQIILEYFGAKDVFAIWLLFEVIQLGACFMAGVAFCAYVAETVVERARLMSRRIRGERNE